MTVVTFEEFTPLPRFDNHPWTGVHIQEATTEAGPWTTVDTKTISPTDADPSNPAPRSFTTELATLDKGWYQLIFFDGTGDEQVPTVPLYNTPDEAEPFLPLVADVGAILRARTKNNNGVEIGTFDSNTRPTGSQVLALIDQAARDVTGEVDYDIPAELYPEAASVIALGTALMVELSYFPEQVATGRSPYDQLKALYDDRLLRLKNATAREIAEEASGDESFTGTVAYGFPEATNYLDKVM